MTGESSDRIRQLATRVAGHRETLAALEAERKVVQEAHDQAERDLFDLLEDQGLRQVKVAGLGTFGLNDLAWARIEDAGAARSWALVFQPDLISLNTQRLSVLVREALRGEEGKEIPPGVGFTTSRKIRLTKEA